MANKAIKHDNSNTNDLCKQVMHVKEIYKNIQDYLINNEADKCN